MQHNEWLLEENITHLRSLVSNQNLQLLPDYEQRVAVLHDLEFIDENSRIELKGKVACEVTYVIGLFHEENANVLQDTFRR